MFGRAFSKRLGPWKSFQSENWSSKELPVRELVFRRAFSKRGRLLGFGLRLVYGLVLGLESCLV